MELTGIVVAKRVKNGNTNRYCRRRGEVGDEWLLPAVNGEQRFNGVAGILRITVAGCFHHVIGIITITLSAGRWF